MEIHVTPPDTEPEASFIIFDGSVLINALPSRLSKTFAKYASNKQIDDYSVTNTIPLTHKYMTTQ